MPQNIISSQKAYPAYYLMIQELERLGCTAAKQVEQYPTKVAGVIKREALKQKAGPYKTVCDYYQLNHDGSEIHEAFWNVSFGYIWSQIENHNTCQLCEIGTCMSAVAAAYADYGHFIDNEKLPYLEGAATMYDLYINHLSLHAHDESFRVVGLASQAMLKSVQLEALMNRQGSGVLTADTVANWKYRAINSAALQILVWNRASSGLSLQFNLETEIFYSIVVVAIHDAIDFRQDVVNRNIQNLFVQALCFGGYAAVNALATLVRKEILTWQERGNIWLTLAAGRMLVWNLCCDRYNAIAQVSQMPTKYTDSSDLPTEKLWGSIKPEINPKIDLDQTITQEQYKAVFERSQTWACWREEAEAALMAKMNGGRLTHDLFCIKTLNTHLDKVLNCVKVSNKINNGVETTESQNPYY